MKKFQPPKGTRDLGPKEMKKMNYVVDAIKPIFEKYGFKPIETPAFESFNLFKAKGGVGEGIKNEIYYFKDKSKRELGLRFEFTVSGARLIMNNPSLAKPFKSYQIGRVWRYDRPQAQRWREFSQADIDIIGSKSLEADAECLACFVECMKKLGFKKFYIKVNSRRLLEELLIKNKVKKRQIKDVYRAIDKLDKIGSDGVKKELKKLKVDEKKITSLIKSRKKPSGEVKELFDLAKAYGIDNYLKFDLSLVRGLDYYTGMVYELYAGGNLSCGGGGRYDNLIKDLGGPDLPATGISFGVNRIITLMEEQKLFKFAEEDTILVANVNDKVKKDAIKIAKKLRSKGSKVEIDLMGKSLKKQLDYANKKGIREVYIVGPKELKNKEVILKDMKTGKEKKVKLTNNFS